MGGELVNETSLPPTPSYTDQFYELFPYYLSIGMTALEYWEGDCWLVKHYLKAHRLKQEHENYAAWLQGAYIYDALCAVSPALHAFAKNPKPMPYHKKPYATETEAETDNTGETKEIKKSEKEIKEINTINASAKFASFMTQWNKQFSAKEGEVDGNTNRQTTN